MRSRREVLEKRKKLRKRLRKAVFEYGEKRITDNCTYWVSSISGCDKCVYNSLRTNENTSLRGCPSAEDCPDFVNRYTEKDLEDKYLKMCDDEVYLAKNYRDLFILNWVLEDSQPDWLEKLVSYLQNAYLKIKRFMLDGSK